MFRSRNYRSNLTGDLGSSSNAVVQFGSWLRADERLRQRLLSSRVLEIMVKERIQKAVRLTRSPQRVQVRGNESVVAVARIGLLDDHGQLNIAGSQALQGAVTLWFEFEGLYA